MPYYELQGVDEVERMRQVRRDLEQQFETADEFSDWLEDLQRQHDARKTTWRSEAGSTASELSGRNLHDASVQRVSQAMGEKQSMERRWEPIIPHLREFQSHLADHAPVLQILPANDREWSWERYYRRNDTGIFRQYGVYLIFSPDEELEYVGVAMNSFHDRIWSHDEVVNRRWTDVIPMAHEYYFFAPALEFFLICRLQPPKNSQYCSYTIPVHKLRHKE